MHHKEKPTSISAGSISEIHNLILKEQKLFAELITRTSSVKEYNMEIIYDADFCQQDKINC